MECGSKFSNFSEIRTMNISMRDSIDCFQAESGLFALALGKLSSTKSLNGRLGDENIWITIVYRFVELWESSSISVYLEKKQIESFILYIFSNFKSFNDQNFKHCN